MLVSCDFFKKWKCWQLYPENWLTSCKNFWIVFRVWLESRDYKLLRVELSVLWCLHQTLPIKAQGLCRRGGRKTVEPEGMDDFKKTVFKHDRTDAHMNPQTFCGLWQPKCNILMLLFKPDRVPAMSWEMDMGSCP